jgi:hypothetical protein
VNKLREIIKNRGSLSSDGRRRAESKKEHNTYGRYRSQTQRFAPASPKKRAVVPNADDGPETNGEVSESDSSQCSRNSALSPTNSDLGDVIPCSEGEDSDTDNAGMLLNVYLIL